MNSLIIIGIMMLAGLLLSRAAKLVKLPNVTAFLVAGLMIGPCVSGIISKADASALGIISEAALGFIAYSIGGEFRLSYLKEIGKAPLTITLFQGIATAACVDAGLILLGVDTPLSLILGAIALATAPAATLMVVRQYKADGPITRTLLPVVAMDDALGLIVFSVSASVAEGMLGGQISA
ncbi:MAG: cation:proton antiporter, partial [Clostridia bacterium]|nr:cation:proton antiporter [Clostridia bacterium]